MRFIPNVGFINDLHAVYIKSKSFEEILVINEGRLYLCVRNIMKALYVNFARKNYVTIVSNRFISK